MFKSASAVVAKRQRSAFDQVLEQLGLTKFWMLVQRSNTSTDAPYHNNDHMYHVARLAYELYCLDKVTAGDYNRNAARDLVVAGLVHDYGHSRGVSIDTVNIATVQYHINLWSKSRFTDLANWEVVSALVASSEFPYVEGEYPPTYKYLRDADLMYGFEPHAMDAVMLGISAEAEHRLGRRMSPLEFLEGQRKFLEGVTPRSRPGLKIWSDAMEEAYAMQKEYATLVEALATDSTAYNPVKTEGPLDYRIEGDQELSVKEAPGRYWRVSFERTDGVLEHVTAVSEEHEAVMLDETGFLSMPTWQLARWANASLEALTSEHGAFVAMRLQQYPITESAECIRLPIAVNFVQGYSLINANKETPNV